MRDSLCHPPAASSKNVTGLAVTVWIFCFLFFIPTGLLANNRETGLYDKARKAYYVLISRHDLFSRKRNWVNVINLFEKVRQVKPDSPNASKAQYMIGRCYSELYGYSQDPADRAESIRAYAVLVRDYPRSPWADNGLYAIARMRLSQGKFEDAASEFRRLIHNYPNSEKLSSAWFGLGQVLEAQGFLEQAYDAYRKTYRMARNPVLRDRSESRLVKLSTRINVVSEEEHKPVPDEQAASVDVSSAKKNVSSKKLAEPRSTKFIKAPRSMISDVRYSSGKKRTRIVIDLKKKIAYKQQRLNQKKADRLYVDLIDTFVDPPKQTISLKDSRLSSIRIAQNRKNRVRFVFNFKRGRVGTVNVVRLVKPNRLVIDLASRDGGSAAPDVFGHHKGKKILSLLPKDVALNFPTRPRVIVLDPGHGGKDPGAIGPNKRLKEKNIVLDVGLKLRDILVKTGRYKVYMTRETDRFIPLMERANIAARKDADLFISIHANASRSRRSHGIEVYYMGLTKDSRTLALVADENGLERIAESDLDNVLAGIAKGVYQLKSGQLAILAKKHLVKKLKRKDKGVHPAPFMVLVFTRNQCPAILAEISYISNWPERNLLAKSSYRLRAAKALFEAIEEYSKTGGRPAGTLHRD